MDSTKQIMGFKYGDGVTRVFSIIEAEFLDLAIDLLLCTASLKGESGDSWPL